MAGRPKTTHCKRGHARVPSEPTCIPCRRYRERLRYDMNAVLRQKKCAYQRQWRRDFFDKNGYHASQWSTS